MRFSESSRAIRADTQSYRDSPGAVKQPTISPPSAAPCTVIQAAAKAGGPRERALLDLQFGRESGTESLTTIKTFDSEGAMRAGSMR